MQEANEGRGESGAGGEEKRERLMEATVAVNGEG